MKNVKVLEQSKLTMHADDIASILVGLVNSAEVVLQVIKIMSYKFWQ